MKVDFTKVLTDVDGTALKGKKGDCTLQEAVIVVLNAVFDDERNLGYEERYKRGKLIDTIQKSPQENDLSSEDVSLVKRLLGKAYPSDTVRKAGDMLEGRV